MKKRVLVTRPEGQADDFARELEALGLEPVVFPVIAFDPPSDEGPVRSAINALPSFHWLVLTSANSIRFFLQFLAKANKGLSDLGGIKVCAVGPKTAEAARDAGLEVDLVPERFQAEGVIESFAGIGIEGNKILFPRAEEGREVLPEGLRKLGAEVTLVPVYRTVTAQGKEKELCRVLKEGIDVITFTSGSTVKSFLEILGEESKELLEGSKIACISAVTAKAAKELGLETDILPEENTTTSLAEAIMIFFIKS